jgi:hypothetical protein
MNERIKELAEQCGFKSNPDIYDRNQSFDIPKFAELIIAECAQACINMGNDYEIKSAGQYQAELFAFAIKQYFGVEEQVTEPNGLHTCPYAEEIHNDYETLCDCDEESTRQCAMDV